MKVNENKRTFVEKLDSVFKVFLMVLLLVYCVSLLTVFIWLILSSLKSYIDFTLHAFSWPEKFVFDNYKTVFKIFKVTLYNKEGARVQYGMDSMLLYSIFYSASTSFVSVAMTTMMAYVISKYNFFGRDFLYTLGIFVMITPIIGSMPAAMRLSKAIGLYDNMIMRLFTSCTCAFSGMNFLLLYGACKGIPWAYAESAFIDGAGHWTVCLKIMLPMLLPTCAVFYVLGFIGSWNGWEVFLVWLPSYPSLSAGLIMFQYEATRNRVHMPIILATFIVVMIPMVILYVASQKLILEKYNIGGLKG